MLVAKTTKGRGVSYMENVPIWHYRSPTADEYRRAIDELEMAPMRNMFAEALYREATQNPEIYVVVADISPVGNMAKFSTEYPERFINVGVAEQSMIGICAGLALKGCQPFAYTIATFSLYRPFEMVRDDLCYQNLPVTVVGMGAGVIYSTMAEPIMRWKTSRSPALFRICRSWRPAIRLKLPRPPAGVWVRKTGRFIFASASRASPT